MMKTEHIARIFVLLLISGMVVAIFASHTLDTQNRIEIRGKIAEAGGWSPDTIHTQVGVPLHLSLMSDDVVHGFAIGQSDQTQVEIKPGEVTDLTLEFDKPGEYTFYCTRWCGVNHWRMRGIIQVDGSDPDETAQKNQPLYMVLNLDIDAPHPAKNIPGRISIDVGRGGLQDLNPKYLNRDYYRAHSPSDVYIDLRGDPALSSISDDDLWGLVGAIWQSNTTPQGLSEGKMLYQENCSACHGEAGAGDGVFDDDVSDQFSSASMGMGHMAGHPASFSDPESMLGASPALLQGKIIRGGMGTGMPYWGPIFTEEQIWNLVAYLYTFQFNYPEVQP